MRGVYLIGFSGTGKSTIAEAVGAALQWPVHDLDRVIVERSGTTIPAIFEREGEDGFRTREAEALRAVSQTAPFVVATGGGAAVQVENRRIMAATGWVITLEARPESLEERLRQHLATSDANAVRPLLDTADPLDRIRALKQRRQSVYALADWTVHTDRLTPAQVAEEVVRAVRILGTTPEPPARFDVPAGPLREAPVVRRPALATGAGTTTKRIHARGKPVAAGRLPLICAPLVATTRDALLAEARAVAAKRPDVIEWRVDFYEPIPRTEEVLDAGQELRCILGEVPLLFTCRSAQEGGRPIPLDAAHVIELHDALCATGCVDLVDYELMNGASSVQRVRDLARRDGVGLVLSFHDFGETPSADVLVQKLVAMEAAGADVAKIAVMPRSREDVLTLLAATLQANERLHIPLVTMSMGPLGALTRACGWMFGSALTFAVGIGSSAPGQIPIDELRTAIEVLRRTSGASGD